jgi:diguanylate cyclase (GGDEF)-like protein
MRNLSTRARLALLVFLCPLPALALAIYSGLERRAQVENSAREDLRRLATLAARQQGEIVEGVKQMLAAMAAAAELLRRDTRGCREFLKRLMDASGGSYHALRLHEVDGRQICDNGSGRGAFHAGDRSYFRLTARTGKFAVGEYETGRDTGLRGINFSSPVLNAEHRLVGVVAAKLDLGRLQEFVARTPLPAHGSLTLLDHEGTILAQQPHAAEQVGQKVFDRQVIEVMRAGQPQLFEAGDADGSRRLFALQGAGSSPDGGVPLHVMVGIPRQVIFAEANQGLFQTIAAMVFATLLLMAGAWYGAETAVLRRIRTLLAMTSRIRAGDLAARTGFPPGEEEISQLGNALDDMAQALQRRDADLKRALTELSGQASTDPLTGLNNRRYLWDFLHRDLIRARRAVLPVAALLFDLDHFKRFNDKWGHEAGDFVLKATAEVVKQNIRSSDIACRYGGEQFVVILPEVTLTVAIDRAQKIRQGIERLELVLDGRPLERVTGSFGIALYPTHADNEEALLRAADEALYRAKEAGRNRIQVYIPGSTLL